MKKRLQLTNFPGTTPIAGSYCEHFEKVAQWFHYNPHDPGAIDLRLAELADVSFPDRTDATAAVLAQQRSWGCGQASLNAARLLGRPNTFAVVTGQQTGLFGGPLYTQLKAISTILMARQLKTRYPDKHFVPVFWMATGDSDFEEVRRTNVIDRQGNLRELSLEKELPEHANIVVAKRDVSSDIAALIENTADWLPGGEHADEIAKALRDAYLGYSLTDGFARWMARMFDGTELVLIDPQDPALKATAFDLMQNELANCDQIQPRLIQRNQQIAEGGFSPQVILPSGDTSLYLLDNNSRREKIVCGKDHYKLRPSGTTVNRGELQQMAVDHGERFVAGVMLRPIYQNSLFPVAAFIGGGGELAYRAQATTMFEHHGQKMAPAFLRATATLLTSNSAALLDNLGWQITDCFSQTNGLSNKAAAGDFPSDVVTAMNDYRETISSADAVLLEKAKAIDPSLEKSFTTLRMNLDKHVDRMEKKITSAIKHRNETRARQVERLGSLVYPHHAVQERVLSALSFLPRYGFGLIDQLMEKLEFPVFEHQVVILD